jgi:hypothetical protein
MAKIEITFEKTQRISKEIEVTEDQLQSLINGENPFFDELESEVGEGDTEYDYTVHDENESCLVDWK